MGVLVVVIDWATRLILLLLIAYVVISYFMDPYHPVRRRIDSIVDPLLAPIRRVVPPVGGTLDLSPLILILIVQIISWLLISIIRSIAS